jgi:hypothetical protein
MGKHSDGGRAALGGFLYQIVAVLGLRALVESRSDQAGELTALLEVNGAIRIEHEKFDSDAVIERLDTGGGQISLIQFKYSRQVPPPGIGPAEYNGFVRALSAAATRAQNQGKIVSSNYLITNRICCTDGASKLRRKQDRDVASRLAVALEIQLERWIACLEEFGKSFGRSDQEIATAVYELVGRIMHSTNIGHPSIDRGDLVKALAGYADAKPIRRDDLETRMQGDLRRVSEDLWPRGEPIRRRQWDQISRAIFADWRTFVVLVGLGGSGKSTALVDWLFRQLRSEAPHRPCIAMNPLKSGHSSWIADIVADWSDLPLGFRDRRQEPTDRVIERIVTANPALERPILVLGLDGLDETTALAAHYDAIRSVLYWFRDEDRVAREEGRRPVASLVVTARRLADIEARFLTHATSGFRAAWQPPTILFDDFSDDELAEIARTCGCAHTERFRPSPKSRAPDTFATIDDELIRSPTSLDRGHRPIDPAVLLSLRHPSMWRAFLGLSPTIQGGVLDGEASAVAFLAKTFTDWFCQKLRSRHQHLTAENTLEALSQIACQAASSAPPFEVEKHWCAPAQSAGLGVDQARTLFMEAKSAGYIVSEARIRWTWRHPFCPVYLRDWTPAGWE